MLLSMADATSYMIFPHTLLLAHALLFLSTKHPKHRTYPAANSNIRQPNTQPDRSAYIHITYTHTHTYIIKAIEKRMLVMLSSIVVSDAKQYQACCGRELVQLLEAAKLVLHSWRSQLEHDCTRGSIGPRLESGVEVAENKAVSTSDKWSAHRTEGGLVWATYKVTALR